MARLSFLRAFGEDGIVRSPSLILRERLGDRHRPITSHTHTHPVTVDDEVLSSHDRRGRCRRGRLAGRGARERQAPPGAAAASSSRASAAPSPRAAAAPSPSASAAPSSGAAAAPSSGAASPSPSSPSAASALQRQEAPRLQLQGQQDCRGNQQAGGAAQPHVLLLLGQAHPPFANASFAQTA